MFIHEHEEWLKEESDIASYFMEDGSEQLECGQGYYTDEATFYAKVGKKYYSVTIKAEIESSKQDSGDRLYWVEKIESVEYTEVDYSEIRNEHNKLIDKQIEDFSNSIKKLTSEYLL